MLFPGTQVLKKIVPLTTWEQEAHGDTLSHAHSAKTFPE